MGKTRMVNAIGRILVGNGEDGNAVRMTAQQNSSSYFRNGEVVNCSSHECSGIMRITSLYIT